MTNHKYIHFKKHAFTILELVMVIVVLGILAALAMPRLDRDLTQEAADNILSDIRYTQHLALMDDKHLSNDARWQQRFWRIVFGRCNGNANHYYMVGSDDNMGSAANGFFAQNEAAIDPTNGKPMFGTAALCLIDGSPAVSDRIFITRKFGINAVNFAGGCAAGRYIGFDHLGRPHVGFGTSITPNYASYMTQTCTINFTLNNGNAFSITIQPETGYAQIVGQNAS